MFKTKGPPPIPKWAFEFALVISGQIWDNLLRKATVSLRYEIICNSKYPRSLIGHVHNRQCHFTRSRCLISFMFTNEWTPSCNLLRELDNCLPNPHFNFPPCDIGDCESDQFYELSRFSRPASKILQLDKARHPRRISEVHCICRSKQNYRDRISSDNE